MGTSRFTSMPSVIIWWVNTYPISPPGETGPYQLNTRNVYVVSENHGTGKNTKDAETGV